MAKVFVAGATGLVGREVVGQLREAGHRVTVLARDVSRAERLKAQGCEVLLGDVLAVPNLAEALRGCDAVVSCLGASVGLRWAGRAGFDAVDHRGNARLFQVAREVGVPRAVYLGVFGEGAHADTRYVRAHAAVDGRLDALQLSCTTVRPVGLFGAFDPFVAMARRGLAFMVGDGRAETNPVHPVEVARAMVDRLAAGPRFVDLGGPEVLSRRALVEMPFALLKKRPRVVSVPAGLVGFEARLLGPLHPRLSELLAFVASVSAHDCVAPRVGAARIEDWYRARLA
ncbi:MAG: NAD(P)H-binding protein [Myxococcales bacterium]|nr:NAD(P)H-binding protein [Myxococcales bacterium]